MKLNCAAKLFTLPGGTLPLPDGLEGWVKSTLLPMIPGYLRS